MKILNQAVLDNLFPAARPAVEPWETFRWHYDRQNRCDTDKPHSSQALAIDVFGTLGGSPARAAILNALAAGWGLPAAPDGEVQLE